MGTGERVVSGRDSYDVYRQQIEHEDELIGTRVGWLIATEAFLFAAYGVVLQVQPGKMVSETVQIDDRFKSIVPKVGIVIALLVGLGIGAAMHRLRLLYIGYMAKNPMSPDQHPSLWSQPYVVAFGHFASAAAAPVLILSWAYVWHGYDFFLATLAASALVIVIAVFLHMLGCHFEARRVEQNHAEHCRLPRFVQGIRESDQTVIAPTSGA